MGKGIIELEQDVKDLMFTDKSDPQMYIALKALVEKILVVKGYIFNAREADELSHEIASDIYLELNDPKKKDYFYIYAPTRYIFRLIKGRLSRYLYEYVDKQVYNMYDPVLRLEFVNNNFPKSEKYKLNESLKDTVEMVPDLIQLIYDKYTRYYKDSSKYRSTLISLYLTIYRGELYLYNDSTDRLLLEFLYKVVTRNVSEYILSNIDQDNYYDLDPIKIFEMSVSEG